MSVNVNAVVERIVEVEQPSVEEPQGVPVYLVTVYDYPDGEDPEQVVTLSAVEHLQVVHSPDPVAAFDRVVEARDAEPEAPEATPAAEAEAEKAEVDLADVQPSGARGQVVKADVVAAEPDSDKVAPAVAEDLERTSPPASEQDDTDGPAPDLQV